jgi:translocator protein
MQTSATKFLNTTALAVVLTVNYLAVTLPLNGKTPREVSDTYFNQFAPAPITFSIWSVIYLLLIGFLVWQYVRPTAEKDDLASRVAPFLISNSLFNVSWLFTWHYGVLPVSLVLMLGILYTLVMLNAVTRFTTMPNKTTLWLFKAAWGVYLGWICIATIANFTAFLVSIGWNRFGLSETFWTGGMIGIGAVVSAYITWHFRNLFIGAAVIWAFTGIIIRQYDLYGHFTAISWAAVTWAMPVIVSMIYGRK